MMKTADIVAAGAILLATAAAATIRPPARRAPAPLPNVVVETQDGRRVRFYDDLVRDRVVLINFMFTRCTNQCPLTTANLEQVADRLGERLGRDVRIISVTLDPEGDTPDVLRAYARQHGDRRGWYFVTGRPEDLTAIRRRLGDRDDTVDLGRHTGTLVYGDAATGQWAAMPALAQPQAIVRNVRPLIDRNRGD